MMKRQMILLTLIVLGLCARAGALTYGVKNDLLPRGEVFFVKLE